MKPKNGKANEFRTKANAIRAELADESKTLTKEEVETKAAGIIALETRAAALDGYTPQEEIERQEREDRDNGVDPALRRDGPDADVEAAEGMRDYQSRMDDLGKKIKRVFGGPNSYLLALARRGVEKLEGKRLEIHRAVVDLHTRAITGTDHGGEFLLPLQQVQSIFQLANEQQGIVQHALRFPVSGRTLRIPYAIQDQIEDEDGDLIDRPMAGIANVSIIGEGDEKPERTPSFGQRLLTVYKVAAYTEIGDETLADDFTGDLAPTVQRMVGGQTLNFMNELMTIDGTGTSMPLGALNPANGALITVQRTLLDQIGVTDIFNMFAKHTFGGGQSFWLIHRTAIPQLFALKLSGNTLVTFLTNLQGTPQMSLLGLPIYMTDLTATIGSTGDLALINGGFYAMAIRQALTVESSIHYKFRNDLTAYRFITRMGGIPIPTAPYSYKAAGETHTGAHHPAARVAPHSPFVVLGHAAAGS